MLLTLPNELLHLIAMGLSSKDTNSLLRTNRRLSSLLAPRLRALALEDKQGLSALHWASWHGHDRLLRLVLESGCDVNSTDCRGATALHHATGTNNQGVFELLFEFGAEVDAVDSLGNTPLHNAAICTDSTAVRALLRKGADATVRNMEGKRASEYSRYLMHKWIVDAEKYQLGRLE